MITDLLADIWLCTLCVCLFVALVGFGNAVSYANSQDDVQRLHYRKKKDFSAEMQEKWWNMFWITAYRAGCCKVKDFPEGFVEKHNSTIEL